MGGAAAALWILFVVVLALAIAGPKRYYRSFQAPLLKNPDANEPSETGYALASAGNWVAATLLFVVALAITVSAAHHLDAHEVGDVAYSAADEIDGQESDSFLDVPSPIDIVQNASSKVHVTKTGEGQDADDNRVEYYEITNTQGEYPWCLSVTSVSGGLDDITHNDYEAEADEGACSEVAANP